MTDATEKNALETFKIENQIRSYRFYDVSADIDFENLYQRKPWGKDAKYFKRVVLTAQSLLKMLIHARAGGNLEIMGLLQGKIRGDSFFITDCFRLPVEGTETRVNAGESANEFMIEFTEANEKTNFSNEMVVGWYHSHPGYNVWLSGTDVATQTLYQSHQDPFVAIVIDPIRSGITGRVEIGAFRTYPGDYSPPEENNLSSGSSIPREKMEDFGAHYKRYYALEVEIYRSEADDAVIELLWSKYWAGVLAGDSCRLAREALFGTVERETRYAKAQKQPNMEEYSEKLYKCCCEHLNRNMESVMRRIVFGAPEISSEMDTSS
jgi:COP9 signalosome complex subunit 5